jgi:hypothetical protein
MQQREPFRPIPERAELHAWTRVLACHREQNPSLYVAADQ